MDWIWQHATMRAGLSRAWACMQHKNGVACAGLPCGRWPWEWGSIAVDVLFRCLSAPCVNYWDMYKLSEFNFHK